MNPNDKGQQALLEEMRAHVKKVCLAQLSADCEDLELSGGDSIAQLFRDSHDFNLLSCLAVGGDEEERGPASVILHSRVQGGTENLHRQFQGGMLRAAGMHTRLQWVHLLITIGCAQKNFGKPVEWGLVKDYAWSTPQLRKLDAPVAHPVSHLIFYRKRSLPSKIPVQCIKISVFCRQTDGNEMTYRHVCVSG